MSTPSRRRLMRDFKKLQDDSPAGICAAPTEDNILIWEAYIFGPQDTPFEDGTFKLTLEFTEEYPNKPPTVKFVSKMFHPNVYADGSICMDLLQKLWTPTYDVAGILMCIQSLLNEPNPTSPANSEAAQLYQDDRIAYEKRSWMNEEAWRQYDVKQTVSHRHPYASASNEYCDDPMTGHGRLASSSSSTDHHPTHNSHRSAVYVKNEIKAEP